MKYRRYVLIAAAFLVSLFIFNLAYSTNNNLASATGQYQRAQIQQGVKLVYDVEMQNLTLTNNVEDLKKAHDLLRSDRYYEMYTQFLVTNELCSDVFLYGYEDGYAASSQYEHQGSVEYSIKALELSPNCFEKFNITCDTGDTFTEDSYGGSEIPVVLGAEYKAYYALHDIIEASYIFKPVQLRVVGFLPSNTVLTLYNYPLILDRYMIIPSWDCEKSSDLYDEQLFQLRHYVNKLEGYYEYEDALDLQAFRETVEEVNSFLSGAIVVTDLPEPATLPFLSFQQTLDIAKFCTYLSVFMVAAGLPLLTILKMQKHFHQICVRYLFGVALIRLWFREFGLYILSVLMATALLVLLNPLFSGFQYMLYPISSFILSAGSVLVFGILLSIVVTPSRLLAGIGGKADVKN